MDDPHLNQKLGPYELKRVVGRGGMGTVYAASEETNGELAAIKVLSPALAADESFRERFAAEIESLKKLQHPNIVRLYGFGEQAGHLFYVMELVEGNSLQEELRRGRRFTWREVSHIAIEVCAALKHAHDHGIIHRDLKPANLLLTADDQIKLFDFGIAKLFGATQLTTGSVMGTADYMAPEQGEGKPVGPRTDLYSLGSVMYALLVGKPPFSGKSIAEVVHKVRFDAPIPVCRLADDVPVEMEHLIEQLLEKQPERRVPTALAVSHRLKAMEHALSVHLPAASDTDIGVTKPKDSDTISNRPTVQLPHSDHDEEVEQLRVITDRSAGGKSHFTRVDESREGGHAWNPWQALGTLLVVASLAIAFFFAIQKWRQPPTADELYEKIARREDSENDRWVLEAEDDVDQFLRLYPDDPRRSEVDELKESIAVYQLQRRLELRARRGHTSESPLEQLYLAAIRRTDIDLAGATRDLQAILDVYSGDADVSPEDRRCLNLAQRQLAILRSRLKSESKAHLNLIQERLTAAAQLAPKNPTKAKIIYQGIIDLYGQQSWAEAMVAEAREAISQLPAQTP